MIPKKSTYVRRKEMDSVLTYLVDTNVDFIGALSKSVKKIINHEHCHFYRSVESAFRELLEILPSKDKNEIIISALSPYYLYQTILSYGYTPIVVDVTSESGLPSIETLIGGISDNTALILIEYTYCLTSISQELNQLDVPVLEILFSGIGRSEQGSLFSGSSQFSIISFEDENILSSMGGALLSHNQKDIMILLDKRLKQRPELSLSGLNATFLNSQILDIDVFFDKTAVISSVYKDSILQSRYYTLESTDFEFYNYFPVILQRSLKDVLHYCKTQGVEAIRGFEGVICNHINKLNCPNAKSLSQKTLLFPISLNMNKNTIKLISKILSTLP